MAKCTCCTQEIRVTKKNIEAKSHFESRHPTSTFAICFPGIFDPTVAPVADVAADAGAAATTVAAPVAAPKKKKEDLSFLGAALESKEYKKK
jgi:hypothetical protein